MYVDYCLVCHIILDNIIMFLKHKKYLIPRKHHTNIFYSLANIFYQLLGRFFKIMLTRHRQFTNISQTLLALSLDEC